MPQVVGKDESDVGFVFHDTSDAPSCAMASAGASMLPLTGPIEEDTRIDQKVIVLVAVCVVCGR